MVGVLGKGSRGRVVGIRILLLGEYAPPTYDKVIRCIRVIMCIRGIRFIVTIEDVMVV